MKGYLRLLENVRLGSVILKRFSKLISLHVSVESKKPGNKSPKKLKNGNDFEIVDEIGSFSLKLIGFLIKLMEHETVSFAGLSI